MTIEVEATQLTNLWNKHKKVIIVKSWQLVESFWDSHYEEPFFMSILKIHQNGDYDVNWEKIYAEVNPFDEVQLKWLSEIT